MQQQIIMDCTEEDGFSGTVLYGTRGRQEVSVHKWKMVWLSRNFCLRSSGFSTPFSRNAGKSHLRGFVRKIGNVYYVLYHSVLY